MTKYYSYIKWLFIILFITGIFSSLLWIYIVSKNLSNNENPHQIDAFVIQAKSKQFSATGKLIRSANIHTIKHYRESNISFFQKPSIVLYTDNSQPWYISSNEGKLLHHNHLIEFKDHVVVYQPKSKQQSFTRITTSILFYNTQTNKAYTNAFVTIERAQSKTTAIGLVFDMKTNRMILKSHMKTHFSSIS